MYLSLDMIAHTGERAGKLLERQLGRGVILSRGSSVVLVAWFGS